jgi:O-methyltransferase involved in polyketide biosynthesis
MTPTDESTDGHSFPGRFPAGGLPEGPVTDGSRTGFARPVLARVRDHWLGGKNAYGPDRQAADRVGGASALLVDGVRSCQCFVHRAVGHLARAGVAQFVELAPGLPLSPAVQDTASRFSPRVRVIYVDHDRVALAHHRVMHRADPRVEVVAADPFHPGTVLQSLNAAGHIDLTEPVAVILDGLLAQLPNSRRAARLLSSLRTALPSRSYLVLTHVSTDAQTAANATATRRAVRLHTAAVGPMTLRSRDDLARLLEDVELLTPGICTPDRWRARPPARPRELPVLACVARLP